METWPPKDPDAVLDYLYTIPLDEGDSVLSSTFERLVGTVNIDSASRTGAEWTVELSGGEAGETSVFRIAWVTTGGREDDDSVSLFISSKEFEALVPTGYAKPLPAHLQARYPAFTAIDAGVIQYWLTDAERFVTNAWSEGDYATGLMALAAHNMTLAGLGTDAESLASIPAGITRMKSGTLELGFTNDAANARLNGDLSASRYGQEYEALLRRNRGGPRIQPTGTVPAYPWAYYG
jgi:hypothetical protein